MFPSNAGFTLPDKMQDEGQWHWLLEETSQKSSNITTTAMPCQGDIKVWPHFPDRMKQGQKKLPNHSGFFSFIELQRLRVKGQEATKAMFCEFHKSWKASAVPSCLWELVQREEEGGIRTSGAPNLKLFSWAPFTHAEMFVHPLFLGHCSANSKDMWSQVLKPHKQLSQEIPIISSRETVSYLNSAPRDSVPCWQSMANLTYVSIFCHPSPLAPTDIKINLSGNVPVIGILSLIIS